MNKEDSYKVLDDYLERGGNFLDTANNYAWWVGSGEFTGDESEMLIGQWMTDRQNRDQVFLATKVGANWTDNHVLRDEKGLPRYGEWLSSMEGTSESVIRQGVEDSLKKLQTDYIDLYYIHVDNRETPLEETLRTMDALVNEGKIRYIGYSNVQTWRLEKIMAICEKNGYVKPVIVQEEYSYINPAKNHKHPYANHSKEEFFDWLNSRDDISLTAYSPLLKGIYVNKERRDEWLNSEEYDTRYNRERIQKLIRIANEQNVSANALVLAWMTAKKEEIIPIIGFSKIEQYMENMTCLDIMINSDLMETLE